MKQMKKIRKKNLMKIDDKILHGLAKRNDAVLLTMDKNLEVLRIVATFSGLENCGKISIVKMTHLFQHQTHKN